MTKVYLGLGSNVGDREGYIEQAKKLLKEHVSNIESAPLYGSKAWGVTEQPDFINTAVCGDTALKPTELLKFIKDVEKRVGRVERFRWGPREIDVDIIFYGDLVYSSESLTIPHVGAHQRDTVLLPLIDLDPELVHPKFDKKLSELLQEIPQQERTIYEL